MTNLSDALDFSRTIGIEAGSESAVGYERGGGLGTIGAVDLYTRSGRLRASRCLDANQRAVMRGLCWIMRKPSLEN